VPPVADLGESFRSFFDAVEEFFGNLAAVQWGSLAFALVCFGIYLTFRSRASFHILRAAYPAESFRWREIWGAYMAGYGFNSVIPARGGDIVRLFLTKNSIPHANYPATASAFAVEFGFDIVVGGSVLIFAFTQGVFPKPPDLSELNAFELSYFAQHPKFTLFLLTVLAIGAVVATGLLSQRVREFWTRVRQGLTILFDRRRYLREVFGFQAMGWVFRFTAFWFLLEAFNIGGSVKNVLLVLGVQAVSAALPFTPGGAGAQQALLVKVFGGSSAVAAYSVGQQIAIAAFTFALGFVSLVFIFKARSFKEVIARGREQREREADERKSEAAVGPAP
jgi:uncharacterized membrane protein YbhN (UPF0104 family)